jgi:hypothetical protein
MLFADTRGLSARRGAQALQRFALTLPRIAS